MTVVLGGTKLEPTEKNLKFIEFLKGIYEQAETGQVGEGLYSYDLPSSEFVPNTEYLETPGELAVKAVIFGMMELIEESLTGGLMEETFGILSDIEAGVLFLWEHEFVSDVFFVAIKCFVLTAEELIKPMAQ